MCQSNGELVKHSYIYANFKILNNFQNFRSIRNNSEDYIVAASNNSCYDRRNVACLINTGKIWNNFRSFRSLCSFCSEDNEDGSSGLCRLMTTVAAIVPQCNKLHWHWQNPQCWAPFPDRRECQIDHCA